MEREKSRLEPCETLVYPRVPACLLTGVTSMNMRQYSRIWVPQRIDVIASVQNLKPSSRLLWMGRLVICNMLNAYAVSVRHAVNAVFVQFNRICNRRQHEQGAKSCDISARQIGCKGRYEKILRCKG